MTLAGKENKFQLTPTQEAMLLYSLYAPKSPTYFEQFCYAYRGTLDVEAFAASWQQVVNRHSILRASFHWSAETGPRQVVHERVELPILFEDWRSADASEQEQRLTEFLEADCSRGFDVSIAPLIRVAVLKTSSDHFYIVISNHHLVLDGWSMGVVRHEVSQIYQALTRGEQVELPPAPDFGAYLGWLQDQERGDDEEFWRQELAGFTDPNSLPIDLAPATLPGPDETFGERAIDVPEELASRLQTVARKHRLTMGTIAQGAWAVLLSRYCRAQDVLFGITVSGRPYDYPEVDSLVGVLINTLPLRVRMPSDGSVAAWLQNLQKRVSELRENETTPLQQIHEWSELPNSRALFETLMVFENFVGHDVHLSLGSEIELSRSHLARTNYPLTLVVNRQAGWSLRIIYHRSRFAEDAIGRLLNHLVTIMESFAGDLGQSLTQVNLLTESENRELLDEWRATAPAVDDLKPVHRLIEEQTATKPDAVAVEHDGQQVTYAQLNTRANRLARLLGERLKAASTEAEASTPLVGICLDRSIEMVVTLLAVMKAGAAYVPLDPTYPSDRLSLMLEDSGAQLLLTRHALREKLAAFDGLVVALDTDAEVIGDQLVENLEDHTSLEDLAYVIYTSGSTGTPKGVGVEHRALANFVSAVADEYELTPGDRVLQFASLSFDTSAEEIYCALARGATLVLRADAMITSPIQFLESCAELGITVLDLPTGYWHHLVIAIAEDDLPIPESLRLVILGGEQANADLVRKWLERAGPKVRLMNTYGPTEATVVTTTFDLSEYHGVEPITIGRPIAGVSVYVLNEALQPVPAGIPGELYIAGAGLARGYLNRPELTAQKFVANPFGEGRLYRSGDLVRYRHDGNLEFLGRADNQVKIRGFRIELEEVEQAIRSHDNVTDAVVKIFEAADGDKRLCAYVVFREKKDMDTSHLRSFLKTKLPLHMIPATFTVLDSLPLSANGKVDRRALPAPDRDRPQFEESFVAPRTPTEELVAAAWCQALKLPRVGIHDNFFELGGHSLLAARVFSELQKTFTVQLNLVDIFNAPTVAGLANLIYEREAQHQQSDELRSLLAELDDLSDEEARRQMSEELLTLSPAR